MKIFLVAVPVLLCASVSTFGSGAESSSSSRGLDAFAVDGTHSTVLFKVRHLGVCDFWGRFNKIGGRIDFDAEKPADSKIEVTIDADSIDSGVAGRDKHLKSPQFFNVKQHAEITFKSTKFTSTGDSTFKVTGDLTLLGETRSVTAECNFNGKKDTGSPRFGVRAGFSAKFGFKRSDFGMNYMVKNGTLGDDIEVLVNLECKLPKK